MSAGNKYNLFSNEEDDLNFYDSEEILNDDNDFDFYDFDSDFKTSPPLSPKEKERSKSQENVGADGQFLVPPPLPLCHFSKEDSGENEARTISGQKIRHVVHRLRPVESKKDSLHNPMICRKRMSWFTMREKLEAAKLENAEDCLSWNNNQIAGSIYKDDVFQSTPFADRQPREDEKIDEQNLNSNVKSHCLLDDDNAMTTEAVTDTSPRSTTSTTPRLNPSTQSPPVNHLIFDSDFESGNLNKATRVYGRNKMMHDVKCMCAGNVPYMSLEEKNCAPHAVDQEYDLQLSCDLHTTGNLQWYYFSVSTPPTTEDKLGNKAYQNSSLFSGEDGGSPPPMVVHPASIRPVAYPLTVRFNIVNLLKSDALYNYGMKPAVYSEQENMTSESSVGWKHAGDTICYFKNSKTYVRKRKNKVSRSKFYTLSFTYTFKSPDTVYFAHCFPYTYTQLQNYLQSLEIDRRVSAFFRRKLLCYTLANNRCDMLTISSPCSSHSEMMRRPVVFISARVHPGETNSSYMMEGFLRFITSENPTAQVLRDSYVFKVVPMLNPDGVIHGNYRCSLAGVDLNRKYNHPDPLLHPTIHAVKSVLKSCQKDRGVLMYLDLHGHSQNKNTFLYGCDPLQSNIENVVEGANKLSSIQASNYAVFSRVFPKVLVSSSSLFASEKTKRESKMKKSYIPMKLSTTKSKPFPIPTCPFSFRDCSLKVQRSKQGTGRVVSWIDVGINASYTVEISFCSSGNNRERKLIKQYAQNRIKSLNEGGEVYAVVSEELRNILKTYQTEKHYSQECLLDLGTQLCFAIASFGNIGITTKSGANRYSYDEDDSDENCDIKDEEDGSVDKIPVKALPSLCELTSIEELNQPILQSLVISDKMISLINSDESLSKCTSLAKKGTSDNFRILAEVNLRKCIRVVKDSTHTSEGVNSISLSKEVPSSVESNEFKNTKNSGKGKKNRRKAAEEAVTSYHFSYNEEGHDDDFNDVDECGSDSDPSGDEASPLQLSQSKEFLKLTTLSKNAIISKFKRVKNSKKRRTKHSRKNKEKEATDALADEISKSKGRSSPAPHRVAIAESALLNPNSTAYNQTISTSARRSTVRVRRTSQDTTNKRITQTYHNFQEHLPSHRVEPTRVLRMPSQVSSSTSLPKQTSYEQLISSPRLCPSPRRTKSNSRAAGRVRTTSTLTPNLTPTLPDTQNEEVQDDIPNFRKSSSVMDAVRSYAASKKSPPLPLPLCKDIPGLQNIGNDKGIAGKTSNKTMTSLTLPLSARLQKSAASSSPSKPQPHALMNSSSKRALLRSSELETLTRLANMDLGN